MSSNAKQTKPSSPRGLPGAIREMHPPRNWGMLVFFLLLIIFNAIFTDNFLSLGTLRNTLHQAVPIIIVGLGMTMVISSGGIDISVGAIMAVAAAVSARLYTAGVGVIPAVACGMLAAALCGLLNGLLIARLKIQPIVVTLVVLFVGRGLAQMIQGEFPIYLSDTPFDTFRVLKLAGVSVQIMVMLIAVGVMYFVAKKTAFARRVAAIGENAAAARLAGVNIFSVTVGVYVLCGFLCGIAGTMEAAEIAKANAATLGRYIELKAIAAVAIGDTAFSGGKARILGTVFGAVVVQLVTVIANMRDLSNEESLSFLAIVLIVAIWSQREK